MIVATHLTDSFITLVMIRPLEIFLVGVLANSLTSSMGLLMIGIYTPLLDNAKMEAVREFVIGMVLSIYIFTL